MQNMWPIFRRMTQTPRYELNKNEKKEILGLLRASNIKTLQALHGIHWAVVAIFISPRSHAILIANCVLCKIALLDNR
jgi:hypothetical protein